MVSFCGYYNHNPLICRTVAIYLIAMMLSCQFVDTDGLECNSMDIRNKPHSLLQLTNCTVIKGSLIFVLMTDFDLQGFVPYSFPLLREITEFMIVYQVYNLTTLGNLFPNLVVIRGQNLFLNYALAIDDAANLTEVGLNSLVSVQRGHIFINRCPNLCYLRTIDWASITNNNKNNVIKLVEDESCKKKESCLGCRDERCWSSKICQKFKDDNLLDLANVTKCHPLCLGGCRNSTAAGCNVCKGLSNHGVCVEKCPIDKFAISEYFRCYTRAECIGFGRVVHQNVCVRSCPAGYSSTNFTTGKISPHECFQCHGLCPKMCDAWSIQHISDADRIKGCTVIRGTLQIRITHMINETELQENLSSIEEIYGYLKITGTSSITSLSFLKGLKKIHGNSLDYNKYALIIYYNQNLFNLWPKDIEKDLVIARGGMFIHSNYRLCFLKLHELQNRVVHNRTLDKIVPTNEEPSCNPIQIKTEYKVLGVNSVTIYWTLLDDINMDGVEYMLYFMNVVNREPHLKRNIMCPEDAWSAQLILLKDLNQEGEVFSYNLTNLKTYTEYGYYLRTYRPKDKEDGFSSVESAVEYFTTEAAVPSQQLVVTYSKTPDSLTLASFPRSGDHDRIDYYVIDLFKQPDKKEILDHRDYCAHPLVLTEFDDSKEENGESCYKSICYDASFEAKIGARFLCSDDSECRNHRYSDRFVRNTNKKISHTFDTEHWPVPTSDTFVKTLAFKNSHENYTIKDLEPYSLYMIHFYACNNLTRCGQYALHSDRTARDPEVDRVFPELGLSNETQHVEIIFEEPKKPNGLTVAYNINIKEATCEKDSCSYIICVTRLNHELANYRYVFNLDRGQYKVRAQSISLAGFGPYSEWLEFDPMALRYPKISWIWYVLTVICATVLLYLFVRWRKKADRIPASALIRYRYTDRDELILNAEDS